MKEGYFIPNEITVGEPIDISKVGEEGYFVPKKVKVKHVTSTKYNADGKATNVSIDYNNITCDVELYYILHYKKGNENLIVYCNEDELKELTEGDKTNEQ